MATQYYPILNQSMRPQAPNVYVEPINIKATTQPWEYGIIIFDDSSTRDHLWLTFRVPTEYVGAAAILIDWSTTVNTNAWRAEFDYRVISGTGSYNQAGVQTTSAATLNAPAAAFNRTESVINLTALDFSADAQVQCALARNNPNAADTMAAAVIMHDLFFQFSDA